MLRLIVWDASQLGLAGDGALEQNMAGDQVRNFFGLQLGRVKLPDEFLD